MEPRVLFGRARSRMVVVGARALFGDDAVVLRDPNFQVLLVAALLPVLGSAMLSPVLDSLIGPFGTSPARIGLMISVFTAPAIVVIPIAGVLADRYGRKPVLVGSLVLFGIAGVLIAFTTDFRVALGLRLLQGVGFGGINPIIITSIGDLYAGAREATGQGLRFMVSGLSGTVFPLVSGVLVVFAWQYPFLVYALALPVAGVVYVWFDEPVPTSRQASGVGGGRGSYVRALLGLVMRRRVFAIVVARALPIVVWIGFITYNSLLVVRVMGGTPPQAGVLVAVGSLVFALAASQAGRITAVYDSRFVPLAVANVLLGVGFAGVVLAPTVWIAGVGITVAGAGFGILLSLYRSVITGLAPADLRAGLVGIAEAGGRVAATLTPIAMGLVIGALSPTLGVTAALQIAGLGAAVVGSVGGLVCLVVARAAPPAPAEIAARAPEPP